MVDYRGAWQAAFEICRLQFSWLVNYWRELLFLLAALMCVFVLFAVLKDIRDKRRM